VKKPPATALAREVLARYGLEDAPLKPVAGQGCLIWRLGGQALRIFPAGTDRPSVQTEIAWLNALQASRTLSVPRPIEARDGSLIQSVCGGDACAPVYAVLLSWVEGRFFDRGLTPLRLRRLGAAVAALHQVSQSLAEAKLIRAGRMALDLEHARWLALVPSAAKGLHDGDLRIILKALRRLHAPLAALPRSPANFGLIHADLHPWNYLFDAERVGIIDFSDCAWGHHAQDIAYALFYLKHPWVHNHDHRAAYPALEAEFLAGYASVRELPDALAQAMPLFTTAKILSLLSWVLLDWPRTDLRAWGPHCVRLAIAQLRTAAPR
jgi:Ser/Thr protein kinase RdoA (MazF antagonist)